MTTYSSKSNAIRAARAGGHERSALTFTSSSDGRWSFESAPSVPLLEAVQPTPAPDLPVTAPAAVPAAAKPERSGTSKGSILIGLASSPEGVTNAQLHEVSGWSKLGGFFDAAKKAGLTLHRCRENGDTRWFAVDDTSGPVAYLQDDDGQWQRFGTFATAEVATAKAIEDAPEGTTIIANEGKRGEIYLVAAGGR